jgi:hypothetical protein
MKKIEKKKTFDTLTNKKGKDNLFGILWEILIILKESNSVLLLLLFLYRHFNLHINDCTLFPLNYSFIVTNELINSTDGEM